MSKELLHSLIILSNKLFRPWPFCHSRPDRSLEYEGRVFGLCARCTAMYTGGISAILTYPVYIGFLTPLVSVGIGLLLMVPGGIDGTTQMFANRESTNNLRLLTGFPLGFGGVLFSGGTFSYILSSWLYIG